MLLTNNFLPKVVMRSQAYAGSHFMANENLSYALRVLYTTYTSKLIFQWKVQKKEEEDQHAMLISSGCAVCGDQMETINVPYHSEMPCHLQDFYGS